MFKSREDAHAVLASFNTHLPQVMDEVRKNRAASVEWLRDLIRMAESPRRPIDVGDL